MTNTTHTLDGPRPLPGAGETTSANRMRNNWVALLITIAVVALAAWAVVQLQATDVTADPQPTSIRQVERVELQKQGVTSFDEMPAVQRSQEQYGVDVTTAPSQQDLRMMERSELRRYRNGTLDPAVERQPTRSQAPPEADVPPLLVP